jgi:plastocyanin
VQGWLLGKTALSRRYEQNRWEAAVGERNRSRRNRVTHFAIATLALAVAAHAQANVSPMTPSGPQPAEIKIVSLEFKYSPARVLAPARHAVTIILDNSGAETEHGIFVPALGFRLEAKPGGIARKTAVFDEPGEFEFSCDLPGHREAGMKGMLIVGQL